MLKNIEDMQIVSQDHVELILKGVRAWNRASQQMAGAIITFVARTIEDGATATETILAAKTLEDMLTIQTRFLKHAYEDGVSECGKIGTFYAELAKNAFVPVERILSNGGILGSHLRREIHH